MTPPVSPPPPWPALFSSTVASLQSACPELAPALGVIGARSSAFERLGRLLDRVIQWNKRLDLTAAKDERQLVDLYLPDALILAAVALERGAAAGGGAPARRALWLDIGSGGGAPGLVLQLLEPALELWLVEPRAKRVAFLRSAAGSLELAGLRVDAKRVEDLPDACCDVALSRATFAPDEWLAHGARLARRGVWVLLARGAEPVLPGWQPARAVDYLWPFSGAERRAVLYERAQVASGSSPASTGGSGVTAASGSAPGGVPESGAGVPESGSSTGGVPESGSGVGGTSAAILLRSTSVMSVQPAAEMPAAAIRAPTVSPAWVRRVRRAFDASMIPTVLKLGAPVEPGASGPVRETGRRAVAAKLRMLTPRRAALEGLARRTGEEAPPPPARGTRVGA
jgi:16S rRNA (guanine527-N7)-methyltransferase